MGLQAAHCCSGKTQRAAPGTNCGREAQFLLSFLQRGKKLERSEKPSAWKASLRVLLLAAVPGSAFSVCALKTLSKLYERAETCSRPGIHGFGIA